MNSNTPFNFPSNFMDSIIVSNLVVLVGRVMIQTSFKTQPIVEKQDANGDHLKMSFSLVLG